MSGNSPLQLCGGETSQSAVSLIQDLGRRADVVVNLPGMTQEPLEIWKGGDFLEVEMVPMRGDGDDVSSSNLWQLRILAALRSDTSST